MRFSPEPLANIVARAVKVQELFQLLKVQRSVHFVFLSLTNVQGRVTGCSHSTPIMGQKPFLGCNCRSSVAHALDHK